MILNDTILLMKDSLLEQYKKQWKWRRWDDLYSQLPELSGAFVYDLGCAHGDHSEKLSSLGASVIGLDGNQELLDYAFSRKLPNVEFRKCDLTEIDKMSLEQADGVWVSFVAAYFTDMKSLVENIKRVLKPGGWIAITEMSGLFDHLPLDEKYKDQINTFYEYMYKNGHYDFNSGSKIKECLLESGFEISSESFLEDDELSKQGPCSTDVVQAWQNRLARVKELQDFLGDEFEKFEDCFLKCLQNTDHVSNCWVYFYFAVKQ